MPVSAIAPTSVLFGSLVLESILAIVLTVMLARHGWPKARIIYVAASPVPAIIIALCIYVFVDAATASKESCGVDACGMAMAAAIVIASAAILLYVIGLVVALVTRHLFARPERDDFKDTFQ